ncbi:NAD(P)-dependent dehydrogenase (short-subunit alcohol dehydrogenase family) [Amaricoccus macauensis]|uniref:NAD(P)-dependent dehydrogenase (Short-subunit alcohol dehydrogenase family) n=1 Tax=Amaricoccus macauensis TaxID=57001 RepID=A0A840SND2_9RHOB|nr:SDR family oxidoreductase [Amaricoccus macauensis]MBB5220811.1 NAD(P)-dependent dehydrogenase (short-subunit alcohol dehydrogenase family) [Amaricoccus macauensis]
MTDASTPAAEPRLVLVTGASRGLGYAVARALGARGDHVIALARTVGGLEALADAIEADGGPSPTLVPVSLTDTAGLQRLGLALHERWGHLALVVHCAAHAAPLTPVPHLSDKDFDTSVEVNFKGTERLIVMMAPLLLARPGGRFVYAADTRAGQPYYSAYGATKAAAEALVRSWAAETVQLGPKVELFHPNPMPTALRGRFFPGEDNSTLPPCSVEAARMIETLDL